MFASGNVADGIRGRHTVASMALVICQFLTDSPDSEIKWNIPLSLESMTGSNKLSGSYEEKTKIKSATRKR